MYNRDYLSQNTKEQEDLNAHDDVYKSKAHLKSFLKATYQLFAGSLLAATVGCYVGLGALAEVTSWYWGLVILEFILIFAVQAVKNKPGINLLVLFSFTFISGVTITPLLATVLKLPGGASIVAQAFLMTSVAFGGISFFGLTTKRDFSSMGKMLFIALIILIVGSISNIFIQAPMLQLGIAMLGAVIFSAFILYDTQRIIKGKFQTPIEAAISLYLDFLNLFISLLEILGIFGGRK